MRILALDTCLDACSVAIWQDGVITAREWRPMQRGHAEALLPMMEDIRARAGLDYADFDRLAVSIGPGSFAGVRVGLAAARGICVARGLPLVGVNTLELLAAAIADEGPVGVAIDARNNQVYFQCFLRGDALCPPGLLTHSQAAAVICETGAALHLVGSGAALLVGLCPANIRTSHLDLLPDAALLAALAATRDAGPGSAIAPLYLRAPDAKLPASVS